MAEPTRRQLVDLRRRGILKSAAVGVFAFQVAGCEEMLSPSDARKKNASFEVLTNDSVTALEALGEILVPGAREGGIAHYVDKGLAVPAADSFLMIRYLDAPRPWSDFYQAGLSALNAHAYALHEKTFAELEQDDAIALVKEISGSQPDGWMGPPAPFFYFALRGDAIDVVYGTPEAFERMDVPYVAHITPETSW